ncbi:unnamed protein product [Brassica rapa]|uniref:SKI-interacting protein SKIP SNW domain-containing protein n=1 Tax=Brassica campestris TaxID=3711 RepID=A0A3P6AY30_BRACM|nr:unnamed protein product [Brassica rapa]VDC89061.1 unnamed protein product [Brassica rapa]
MASHKSLLPPTKSTTTTFYDHSNAPWFKNRFTESDTTGYLKRQGYPEDFGDGGAFPEILVVQYPLGMGKSTSNNNLGSKTLPDAEVNVVFDAIARQNENSRKNVYSQHKDTTIHLEGEEEEGEELQKQIHETTEETKAAMEKVVNVRLRASQPTNVPSQSGDSKYIEYEQSSSRIIRMVEMPVDPLDPPKFRHKRVPKASGSPPVPVMHSPPRPVTVKDQQDWKIPPCISNWKNQKGYAIPLDKRHAADGRGLQDVQINDSFAKLSESLYVAEEKAREAVSMRSKVQKEMVMKEKERKEQELRALAQKARSERSGAPESESTVERMQRETIREERRREGKDAAMGKKSKITRDRDRDISEKVALGMAGGKGGEVVYDQRLFNQEKGMDSGFATDDQYNVYDKSLFTAQPTLSTLYKPKKDTDEEMYGNADQQLGKVKNTERFKPDKGFTGASERSGKRERPVEFDKEYEQDPFDLGQFMSDVKTGNES